MDNTYMCSNLFLLSPQTAYLVAYPLEMWVKLAHQMGYAGLEWTPLRQFALASVQLNSGLVSTEALQGVLALHQSYLSETTLQQAKVSGNPVAVPSYLIMDHRYASLTRIMAWEHRYFHNHLPVVVYPPDQFEFPPLPQRFHLIDKILFDWDIESVEDLIVWARQRNLRMVYDLWHSRNLSLGSWQEVWPRIMYQVDEIHVRSANAIEAEDLYTGRLRSELASMLRIIRETGWQGDVVMEVPIPDLNAFGGIRNGIADAHRRLLAHVTSILD